jgi:hypothetical protein
MPNLSTNTTRSSLKWTFIVGVLVVILLSASTPLHNISAATSTPTPLSFNPGGSSGADSEPDEPGGIDAEDTGIILELVQSFDISRGDDSGNKDLRYIVVDPEGTLFVADYSTGIVYLFDTEGRALSSWETEVKSKGQPLRDLAADAVGNIYAVRSGVITKYEGGTGTVLATIAEPGGLPFIDQVAIMPDGNLVALSIKAGEDDLIFLNAQGRVTKRIKDVVSSISEQSESSLALSVAGDGSIYIASSRGNLIYKYSPEGEFINFFGGQGDNEGQFRGSITGFVATEEGKVFVADFGSIQIFDENFEYLGSIPGPGGAVRDMVLHDDFMFAITATSQIHIYRVNS